MPNNIHATAMIGPGVKLGDHLTIGPYAVIDGEVTLGNNIEIGAHATVSGQTTLGAGCRIFPHAAVGLDPQDKKHKPGDRTFLEMGSGNVVREFVTINRGTLEGGGMTRIGNRNLFMAYAHVAHDCIVGDDNVFANVATLAGHVTVEDRVVIGGLTAVHQFVHLGKMAMLGGCSKITQDVPPYGLCDGNPAAVYGVNVIGLKRAQVPLKSVKLLKDAFRILFHSGLAKSTAVAKVEQEIEPVEEIQHLLRFVKASERGLLKGASTPQGDGE
jgi:UDP-N-acetylglucosamine acyltransferase